MEDFREKQEINGNTMRNESEHSNTRWTEMAD